MFITRDFFNRSYYHSAIKNLFEKDSKEFYPNMSYHHAKYIIEEIFNHAHREIRIFCKNLDHDMYTDERVLVSVRNAAASGIKIRFIVYGNIDDTSEIYKLLGKKCFIKIPVKMNCDFVVGDKKMFWYNNTSDQCPLGYSAVFCANCVSLSTILINFFNKILYKKCL